MSFFIGAGRQFYPITIVCRAKSTVRTSSLKLTLHSDYKVKSIFFAKIASVKNSQQHNYTVGTDMVFHRYVSVDVYSNDHFSKKLAHKLDNRMA